MTKRIEVGSWDSPGQVLEVADNTTVQQAFQLANRSVNANQKVSSMNTNRLISLNEVVGNGESYFLTENHESGL